MLGYAVFALRYLRWFVGNLRRRLRKPPNYVVFVLEGAYPDLRSPRAGFWRRRLFSDARLSLQELGERFRTLQQDPRITGVVLQLRPFQL